MHINDLDLFKRIDFKLTLSEDIKNRYPFNNILVVFSGFNHEGVFFDVLDAETKEKIGIC